MDEIFSEKEFLIVYIDDMLICSKTYQEHLTHLKEFSKICIKNGIILSQKRVEINKNEIEFLGMIISKNGIELQTHISKKIIEFPDKLTTKHEIQRFLGCLNYAGKFISDLAKKRNILQKLIRKSNKLGWIEEHTQCIKN